MGIMASSETLSRAGRGLATSRGRACLDASRTHVEAKNTRSRGAGIVLRPGAVPAQISGVYVNLGLRFGPARTGERRNVRRRDPPRARRCTWAATPTGDT